MYGTGNNLAARICSGAHHDTVPDVWLFIFNFIVVVILGGNADAGPSNEIRVVGDESINHKLLQRVSITTSLTAAVH